MPVRSKAAALVLGLGLLSGLTLRGEAARADGLGIGDPAPPIVVTKFVKGDAITKPPAGKVSVVEFWATWCGPCKVSIPHLTEMAKKYPGVRFVGVSVWEQDQALVAPFVTQMGDKMGYSVAMDSVPTGGKGNDGVMAKTWMQAAGQNGIPTAFIIGTDGKIDWIGHPMEMDEPLAKITAGNWDLATATATFKQKQAQQARMMALNKDLMTASKTGDPKQILAVLDKAVAEDPALESMTGSLKFRTLLKSGDTAGAVAYGNHLVDDVYKDPQELNSFAWPLVDPAAKTKPTAEVAALGLRAAQKADSLSDQKSWEIADTLAAAYFATGDTSNAIKTQERAVALAKKSGGQVDPGMTAHLDTYQKASAVAAK